MGPAAYGNRGYPIARVYKVVRFVTALKIQRPIGLRRIWTRMALVSVTDGQDKLRVAKNLINLSMGVVRKGD